MNKIVKLLKETVWDFIKDNIKLVIGNIIALFIALVPNYINKVSSLELKIKLSAMIFFALAFCMLIVNIVVLIKKYNSLKNENEELKNPANTNVNKFQQGDVVILKTEKDLPSPPKLSVYKITNSEIVCRSNKGNLVNYSPEELLTKTETEHVFQILEYERRKIEQENQSFWSEINKY